NTDGSVSGLDFHAAEKLFFAKAIHSGMPVNIQEARSGGLALVGDQKKGGNRLDAVEVEDEAFQRVAIVLFRAQQLWHRRFVLPWQIAQQAPKFFSTTLLIGRERFACFKKR